MNSKNNGPIRKFSCGLVTASIWATESIMDNKLVTSHYISIDRAYQKDGEWEHTTSFYAQDLPKLSLVTQEAYRFLNLRTPDVNALVKEEES